MAEFKEISANVNMDIMLYFGELYEKCLYEDYFLVEHGSGMRFPTYEEIFSDGSGMRFPTYEEFVVSLYAMTPNADSRVLQELSEYRVDLAGMPYEDMLKEFGAVIRYCSRYDYRLWPSKRFSCMVGSELIELCLSLVRDYCGSVVADKSHRIFKTRGDSGFQRIPSMSSVRHIETPVGLSVNVFSNDETYSTPKSVFKEDICGDVLFPFADDIQFAQALGGCSFDVYEPDSKFWAFGQILKEAYSRDVKIQLGSVSEKVDGKLYDYVFSCPVLRKDVRSVAEELYKVATTRLKDNGIMCCLLPEEFCYAPEWLGFRKILNDKKGQYSALIMSLPDFLKPHVAGNICVFCLLKPNRDEILNSYYGIIDGDKVKIKEGNWVTDDVGRVEKWLDEKINMVVCVNAKKDDFYGGYRLYNQDRRFPPLSNEEDNTWHPNFQVVLDAISALGDSIFAEDNEIMVSMPVDSKYVGDNVNILPSSLLLYEKVRFLMYGEAPASMSPDENYDRLEEVVDLLDLSAHPSSDNDGEIRCLDPSDLFTDYLNCDISCKKEQKTTKRSLKGYSKTARLPFSRELPRVTEKCILVSYSDGKLRVGRIVDPSCQYELSPEIIAFKVKSEEVSEDFLLKSLMSENVRAQMQMLSWGRFYSSIDPEDFLQIRIPVPSKEEQERLFREDVQKSLEKADRKLQESNEEFRRDIHMKAHAMGQTIFALGDWLEVLQRARRENGGTISDDTVVGTLRQVAVGEIYDNLRKTVKHLQEQIYKMDRGNGLKKEDFALTTFIEEYVRDNRRSEFEFEYNAGEHHRHKNVLADDRIVEGESEAYQQNHRDWNSGDGEPIEYVYFPKEALKIILDNIVSNACSHGFTDPDAKNIIKIEVDEDPEDENAFLIRVSNNGKPIDEKRFPLANVFIYGSSSASGDGEHFGLGGYEVKHLMWEFGGDAKLIPTQPDEEFTVCYELKLPKGKEASYTKNV